MTMAARGGNGPTPLPENRRTLWQAFLERFGRTVIPAITRVRVEGLENIPAQGSLIVATNHCSNADGVFVACWIRPRLTRPIHFLAKEEAMQRAVVGWFLRSQTAFGVKRTATDIEAFRVAARILTDGNRVLGGFPEGTRSPDGRLQQGRDGMTMMALKTGAAILPIGISGTERFWPKGSYPRPGGHVTMRVGKPFTLAEVLAEASEAAPTEAAPTRTIEPNAKSPEPGATSSERGAAPAERAPARVSGRHRNLDAGTEEIMTRIAILLPEWQRGFYTEQARARIEREKARRTKVG